MIVYADTQSGPITGYCAQPQDKYVFPIDDGDDRIMQLQAPRKDSVSDRLAALEDSMNAVLAVPVIAQTVPPKPHKP